MAYNRTTWVNGETPLSADNMNNIENGIEENAAAVAELNGKFLNLINPDDILVKPSIYNNRADSLSGGYNKYGKLVIVDLKCRLMTSSITSGTNFCLLSGFPTGIQMPSLSCCVEGSDVLSNAIIDSYGYLYLSLSNYGNAADGKYISINGVYYAGN